MGVKTTIVMEKETDMETETDNTQTHTWTWNCATFAKYSIWHNSPCSVIWISSDISWHNFQQHYILLVLFHSEKLYADFPKFTPLLGWFSNQCVSGTGNICRGLKKGHHQRYVQSLEISLSYSKSSMRRR
jgi:hypothetical protein